VDHPINRFVMEDLVEGTEPRCRVVAWNHQEAEALQPARASGTAFQYRRADLGHAVPGGAPRKPIREPGFAHTGHPGHRHRGEPPPEQPAHSLGSRRQAGQHAAGDGCTDGGATRVGQDRVESSCCA
jgi:hypothetical protein